MARTNRIPVHRRQYARIGRGLERHGAGIRILRRRSRRLEYQPARAARRLSQRARVRELCPRASAEARQRQSVIVHIVRNWTSRSPRLMAHLRKLRALCEARGIKLSTRHLPSVLNLWADRLSRRRDSTTWGLTPTSTLLLARCLRAYILDGEGLPPPRAGSYGPPPLVLPRPALLPVWHRHLQELRRGFLVGPAWAGQSWYQDAVRSARLVPPSDMATHPWPSILVYYGRPYRPPPLPRQPLACHLPKWF
jgi:hypothetical protein